MIGAGAAGLVASRHLLRCGVRPLIFETSTRAQGVGGAWNAAGTSSKMWDNLTPNLSKYTCVFSDFLWPEGTPTFPARSDMQNYLESYATSFVDPECFRFGCTVTNVKRTNTREDMSGGFCQPFKVEWADQEGAPQSQEFDGVIVATGFFSSPVYPEGLSHLKGDSSPLIHSSQYKRPEDFCNQTVAVCGSSFSGMEIASDVRKQAAKVISIVPRVPWVLPRYVPMPETTDSGGSFAPLDAVLYRRTQDTPQIPAAIGMHPEGCQRKHEFLATLAGPHKQQQSPLGIPSDYSSPPLVAISDDYLNLVIDGSIDVVKGRSAKATISAGGTANIELEGGQVLEGLDRIIACTGYQSQLDFLEPDVLKRLEYDPRDSYAPLTLCYDTFHPQLPGLGFVGMYKGPYFGVMELQARLLAGLFSGRISPSESSISGALKESKMIRAPNTARAQFPRHDYIGFMDTLAEQCGVMPSKELCVKGIMVSPPFYQSSADIALQCKIDLEHEMENSGGSVNMAKAALSALIGKWDFMRTITQYNNDMTQSVTGTIDFSHIPPPKQEGSSKQGWNAVLYNENGIFHMGDKDMEVFRQYEYEYKDNNVLEIYFVEQGRRAHLFLSLKFTQKEDGYWVATSEHLCIKDLYAANFKIKFDGIGASEVAMIYRVRGPQKDYESVTHLRPHQ